MPDLHLCEEKTLAFLGQLLTRCWDELDTALYAQIRDRDTGKLTGQPYLRMQEARGQRSRVESLLAATIQRDFLRFSDGLALDCAAEGRGQGAGGDLALDIQRAITGARQAAERSLRSLNLRLAWLRGGRRCAEEGNPLGPTRLCLALQAAIRDVDLEPRARLAVFGIWCRYFRHEAPEFYHQLNTLLIGARILPHLRLIHLRSPPRLPEPEPDAGRDRRIEIHLDELGAQLCMADGCGPLSARALAPACKQAKLLPPADYLSVARELLRERRTAGARAARPREALQCCLQRVMLIARSRDAGLNRLILANLELHTRLFEELLATEELPAELRTLLAELYLPLVQPAIAEPTYFTSASHRARQLVDGLCEHGSRWIMGQREDASVLAKLRLWVGVLDGEDGFSTLIDQALSDFRCELDYRRTQAALAEQRSIAIARGVLRLDDARAAASAQIRSSMARHGVGTAIVARLQRPCRDFLTFARLQQSPSLPWADAMRLMDGIAMSVKGQLPRQQLIQFQRGQQRLLNALRRGLRECGYDGMLAGELLEAVRAAQQVVLQSEPGGTPERAELATASQPRARAPDQLRPGHWYRYSAAGDPRLQHHVRLAWQSAEGQCLFVDVNGREALVAGSGQLAALWADGSLGPSQLPPAGLTGTLLEQLLEAPARR